MRGISAGAEPELSSAIIREMSWFALFLLLCAVAVVVAAEGPRLDRRVGGGARVRRDRARRKQNLRVVRDESDELAASVQRAPANLPTIEERDRR